MNDREFVIIYEVEDRHWWFAARRRFIEVFLGKPSQKKFRIADIGAGTGGTTAWLSRYGDVVGIEPSALGRSLAQKRGVRLKKGTAEKTGLPASSTDVVTILDVLYHKGISDDLTALKEAYRILRPGGTLLITDCAFARLGGRHHRAVHGARRYTLPHMASIIRKAGFAIDRKSYTFFFTLPLVFLKRLVELPHRRGFDTSDLGVLPLIVSLILDGMCRLEAILLRLFPLPIGSSVMVRAQKPAAGGRARA